MNTDARPDQLPLLPFLNRAVGEPRIPLKWYRKSAAIVEFDNQGSAGDPDVLSGRRFGWA